ncbi:uncharacterized protein LOC101759958 [Setaria italica]|uniref:uncharacterized protein LOC101759958 n=1 Tax=Setaria italica TaxID=4555 RepID=UPI000351227C|nr:uncharacterized protein LOC101759958 [Setaria italica]
MLVKYYKYFGEKYEEKRSDREKREYRNMYASSDEVQAPNDSQEPESKSKSLMRSIIDQQMSSNGGGNVTVKSEIEKYFSEDNEEDKKVASESVFSSDGRILDDIRSSLTSTMVERLICASDREPEYISIEENTEESAKLEEVFGFLPTTVPSCPSLLSSPAGSVAVTALPSGCLLGGFSVLCSRAVLPLSLAPPPRFLRRLPHPRAVSSSSSSQLYPPPPPGMEVSSYKFGPYKIDAREVFHATPLSYAMVNLRPLLPGHVLVCPKREVKRFADLSSDETSDLWVTAKEVGVRLEKYHKASSLTFAIQDGPQAGQTVPHVHIHVIPRKKGDFEKNDEIYDAIDVKEKELKEKLDLDIERKDRSMEEMAHEANEYRALFSI